MTIHEGVWYTYLYYMFCDPGPMVYGICFCPVSKKEQLKDLKVAGNPVGLYLCRTVHR